MLGMLGLVKISHILSKLSFWELTPICIFSEVLNIKGQSTW